mmetsp:Transcript_22560/g.36736  ORF Transcript_22560/g.36736 Transcript_22560/m.36736 type:complete len:329 (-) Transcript_22560:631-1617(-)
MGGRIFPLKQFRIDPLNLDPNPICHAAMGQRLGDGFIGVFQLGVLANDGNFDLAIGVVDAVAHVLPFAQVRLGGRADLKCIQNRLIHTFAMVGQRRVIDGRQVLCRNHALGAHIAKKRQFLTLLGWNWPLRPANQNVRRNPDGTQFLDRVLRRLGFQLTACLDVGQQREVHENALPTGFFLRKLADRFKKGQALNVADRPADFAQHEVNFIITDVDEVFDFVGHMGDHLDCLAQIIASAFLFQHGGIDTARGYGIGIAGGHAGEPLVMAQIKIGFGPVIGHEHFTMLKRRHRAGVDVQIGVKLAQPYRKATRLQQCPQRGRGQPLAKR